MSPLTVEDRLLIKTLRIEKGWAVDRMIAEFQPYSGNGVLCIIL